MLVLGRALNALIKLGAIDEVKKIVELMADVNPTKEDEQK
jgi:hypothetical protein